MSLLNTQNVQEAALRLHAYLIKTHWDGSALVGPDPIGKVQWRITRFVRSYCPWLPGNERYVYLQGQAYWIRSNLSLYALTQDARYLEYARANTDHVVRCQNTEGVWFHPPIPGRRGFISTVEGVWASLGLVAAYEATQQHAYLAAADRWYEYQVKGIGFQPVGAGLAANYYAHSTEQVPNVTTMLVWLALELHRLTGAANYLEYVEPMVAFLAHSQLSTGELPYVYQARPHFMCFQYNAFQFLDLAHSYALWPDERLLGILRRLAAFLATGVTATGACRYNCFKPTPEVTYWGGAIATALRTAHDLGLGDFSLLSERAYQHLVSRQRPDGGFDFSHRNYGLLSDRRSYPRYLAMILRHLLARVEADKGDGLTARLVLAPIGQPGGRYS
jgi:hypothetical protein